MSSELNHFDSGGNAVMVDVSGKNESSRVAIATGSIWLGKEVFGLVVGGNSKKGDVLGVARVAGIMAVKKTSELIPMCHTLLIEKATVDFELDEQKQMVTAFCEVKTSGKTGVEMEALTGVSATLLTIYDMCKAVNKAMVIKDICLLEKIGGKSGAYKREK